MSHPAPTKPLIALTLAVAGKRRIPGEAAPLLEEWLALTFDSVAARLVALHEAAREGDAFSLRFRRDAAPRLTLVTGLADGADQIASRVFMNAGQVGTGAERRLGAVLACPRETFIANSPVDDLAGFEAAAAACDFIIEMDGDLPPAPALAANAPPTAAQKRARVERGRTFSDHSELLLRQADILVAVDDPVDEGRVGGTRQSVRAALDLGMPVILLGIGRASLAILRSRADLDDPAPLPLKHAHAALWSLVTEMVGAGATAHDAVYVQSLLAEFYAAEPPRPDVLTRLWEGFEGWFRPPGRLPSDEAAPAYQLYRRRASALSAHYASLYRGSFLMGYALAVVAVLLAVGALALFPLHAALGLSRQGLEAMLLLLGIGKLAVVVAILRLTGKANDRRLAHRASDYRYLAERLRAMIFLPHAGAMRSAYNWSLPYTTRVAAQDAIDRLFLAIVRQADPLEVALGLKSGVVLRPEAGAALAVIRTRWLAGQRLYHERNHLLQHRMCRWLEQTSRRLNQAVIGIVVVDLALALLSAAEAMPRPLADMLSRDGAPLLIALAAVLPAAVASLNGVQFQSECSRLADRSEHMAAQLRQLEDRADLARPRALRLLDALRLGEDVARTTIDEVAEWSAIYGKDFVEM